ncbi:MULTISPECIES: nuclear transport factor 2 family protein [Paenibacillus]|uniref:nuclear transport factor 2 family protein n=1 Tax=Paenibacillus TaxID=44249 RepID=UPI0022B91C37|nr:nuclear transport factor 2 family protein [Paenibacillus caseinilyticus]MCZ8522496.1 nuclear transport factor 2 family protein [Paenibacillus caseinilyticus]
MNMKPKDAMTVRGTEGSMQEIVRVFMESLLEWDIGRWVDLFHEDAVFEFPYAPAAMTRLLNGRAAIQDYIREFPNLLVIHDFSEPVFHPSSDPEQGVVEFGCRGESVQSGKPYHQSYISVIRLKEGRIIHYKDYWNPLVVLEAMGGGDGQ